jgi:carbon monoxide dehydrogenase subunit G
MPTISETITIPSPADDVWPLLSDPALVASCIPGATLLPERDGDAWKGSIRVKFGPTVAVFRGEATLTYDHTARVCTIEGRGIDQRGASRALASGTVSAKGNQTTELTVDGTYSVSGPLETFANAGGVHVARALLSEFSTNMASLVAERRSAATADAPTTADSTSPSSAQQASGPAAAAATVSSPSATPASAAPPPRVAAELSATKLLWMAFLSWLRQLLPKGK